MAQFLDLQAKEDEKSGNETTEEEEATESDIGFIAPENTPEKSREMSELEKMDAKLDKSNKKKPKPKSKRKRESSDDDEQTYDLVIVEKKANEKEKEEEEEEISTPPPKPKKKKKYIIQSPLHQSLLMKKKNKWSKPEPR